MHKKQIKNANFDAGNFSQIEFEVLDMMLADNNSFLTNLRDNAFLL